MPVLYCVMLAALVTGRTHCDFKTATKAFIVMLEACLTLMTQKKKLKQETKRLLRFFSFSTECLIFSN